MSCSWMQRRTWANAAGVGKKRIDSGTRTMRTPSAACAESNAGASGCDDAVSTTKDSGSRRLHSSHR